MSTERTALPVVESSRSCCGASAATAATAPAETASCCRTDAGADDPTA